VVRLNPDAKRNAIAMNAVARTIVEPLETPSITPNEVNAIR